MLYGKIVWTLNTIALAHTQITDNAKLYVGYIYCYCDTLTVLHHTELYSPEMVEIPFLVNKAKQHL